MRFHVPALALASTLLLGSVAYAQRPDFNLPPTFGATVLSTYIDAEARRIAATGFFLESAAHARLTNAEAHQREIQNAKLWLETYFERKRINQEYRRAQNPSYIDQEKRRDQVREKTIVDLPSEITNGDVTDDLNWLLEKMISDERSYELIFSETIGDIAHLNRPLSPDEISHISLREATGSHAGGQSFRADSPVLLSVAWPMALSGKEFADEGAAYEEACLQAIAEGKRRTLDVESWMKLRAALDQLTHKFNVVYSREAMDSLSGNDRILLRDSGKRFLQAQAVGVARAFTSKDMGALERKYAFTGTSVVDLVRHCGGLGLEFAPPTSDDRAVYWALFHHLRQMYLQLRP